MSGKKKRTSDPTPIAGSVTEISAALAAARADGWHARAELRPNEAPPVKRERCLGCGEWANEVWHITPCSAGNGYESHAFTEVDEEGMAITRPNEATRARLDEDHRAKPLTEIVGVFPAGKKAFYNNAETLIHRDVKPASRPDEASLEDEEPECFCGHVRDEHSASGECQVQVIGDTYCPCAAFETTREEERTSETNPEGANVGRVGVDGPRRGSLSASSSAATDHHSMALEKSSHTGPTSAEAFDGMMQNALNLYGGRLAKYDREHLFAAMQSSFATVMTHARCLDNPTVACRICHRSCRFMVLDTITGKQLPGYCDVHGEAMLRPIEASVVPRSDTPTVESSKWPCFFCGSNQAHETGFPTPGSITTVPACKDCATAHTFEPLSPERRAAVVEGLGLADRLMKDHAKEIAEWKRRAYAAESALDALENKRPETAPLKVGDLVAYEAGRVVEILQSGRLIVEWSGNEIGERNAAVEAWARASLAAIDEACPLSGDDWLLTADVMSAWQDARRAYEAALKESDP